MGGHIFFLLIEIKLPSEPEVPLHEPLVWRTRIFEPLDSLVLQVHHSAVGELPGKSGR